MRTGDTPCAVLDHLSWPELLRRWSAEAIEYAGDIRLAVTPEMAQGGWIGAGPASSAAVDRQQDALGVTLPPSYREFLAVTDGWPVTSMDFGAVRPIGAIDWATRLEAQLIETWRESGRASGSDPWPAGSNDGPPLLERSLVLSTGTDLMLIDSGRIDAAGEWISCGFTNWYPGAGDEQPTFRLGLESHYASFVCFTARDSVTLDDVSAAVDDAYSAVLRGEVDGRDTGVWRVLERARAFGDARADALVMQLEALQNAYRAGLSLGHLQLDVLGPDPMLLQDGWPLFVTSALDPHDRSQGFLIEQVLRRVPPVHAARLRDLAAAVQRDGGLTADFSYAPAFAPAVDRARQLLATGRPDEAFETIIDALPQWRPISGLHLAPLGVLWDRQLAPLFTPPRRIRLLRAARGGR